MKRFIFILLSVFVSGAVASKPGINASFAEKTIVNVAVGESQAIDLKINYSADSISYELQTGQGLEVVDLKQSSTANNQLIIPLEIKVHQAGRYYLHVRITSVTQGVESKGVLSRIISSDVNTNEAVQKKNLVPNKLRIMPVVETVKDVPHE